MRPHTVRHRKMVGVLAIVAGVLIGFIGFMAFAQTPNDTEALAAELIGARVYAAEGTEVGTVSAVTVAQDGRIREIRFTTPSRFGLDARTVAVAQDNFVTLTGAVVLDLSAEEVDALPVQTVRRGMSS